jgi:biotin carboxyl carrier protein
MKLRITVEGKPYDVEVEVVEESGAEAPIRPAVAARAVERAAPNPVTAPPPQAAPSHSGKNFPSPLAGTVRAIKVAVGDSVAADQEIILLEAMKMETSVSAPAAGRIKAILVAVGDAVQAGQPLVEIE